MPEKFFISLGLMFILFLPLFTSAQRFIVRVDGIVMEEKNKLDGVSVSLYVDGEFLRKSVTENNGKFRFELNYDTEYEIIFSKPGYVTKKVSINTFGVPADDQDFGHEFGGWELSLFRIKEGLDLSLFDKPFVKISYNDEEDKFVHDVEYTQSIKDEYDLLVKELSKKKKSEAKKAKEEARAAKKESREISRQNNSSANDKINLSEDTNSENKNSSTGTPSSPDAKEIEYTRIVKEADNYFNKNDYDNAKKRYTNAQNIKPLEKYPQQKIQEINMITFKDTQSGNKARRDTGHYKTKEEFLQALARLYPKGITEEVYMEGNVKITRRILVDHNTGTEFKMAEHPWGGKFWFKNGTPVNESVWNSESEPKK